MKTDYEAILYDVLAGCMTAVIVIVLWPIYFISLIQWSGGKDKLTKRAELIAMIILCCLWWALLGVYIL
jgi:hypothetical protein